MTKKQNATEKKTSKSADGKTWVMPEAKPKAVKKGPGKKITRKQKAETSTAKTTKAAAEKKAGKRTPVLSSFEGAPTELVATYKGAEHKATVNPDGTITINGKTFNSPSRAGKEVTGREVDGWTFWSYEVPGNGLKKLNALRKVVGK
jgi:hypothetical protein